MPISTDIGQELIQARVNRMLAFGHKRIDEDVCRAVEAHLAGAMEGLQGLSSEEDGVTHGLWVSAVEAIDGSDLIYPGWDGASQPAPEPCSFEMSVNVVAGRVARAILALYGWDKD